MKLDYYNIEELENVYLEDSYVLRIKTDSNSAEFRLSVVLTENHPLYNPPKQDEYYCCKKAVLSFPAATEIIWVEVNIDPAIDANGEVDFGNIDSFFYNDQYYELSGSWGELKIQSAKPTIKFMEE